MNQNLFPKISNILSISERQIHSAITLLEEGSTIPFISRYRKEKTGGLDEVQVGDIQDRYAEFTTLEKRREFILESILNQDKLTDALKAKILNAQELTRLEDIYLPFKQKKKTRAEKARNLGLEPLAKTIFQQDNINLAYEAEIYVTENIDSPGDALAGARDIIAEWINEDTRSRSKVRELFENNAKITSKVIKSKQKDALKFKDYFESSELLQKCPSHRLLAMRRGETEGFLRVSIAPSESTALNILSKIFVKGNNDSAEQVKLAIADSYKRLLGKSIETEFAKLAKEEADNEAITVFVTNLRQLLLAAPLGQKRMLAIDPGFRTGCKVVVLDEQGNLVENSVIYLLGNDTKDAEKKIKSFVKTYDIEAIAIGNGTASRETEDFIKQLKLQSEVFIVSEDGASIYSASAIAREEFPDKDITVRGAVSIGRRLMDPLAELTKIDPKSIGIGQYQHDVDQTKLKKSLDTTVESCVNLVGVNLNTSSKHILTYISGLGPTLAQNIVDYRKINGTFKSRIALKKVKKLGPKAFEQCAGFLRIMNAKNPLDNSAVHPESYHIVESMAKDTGTTIRELLGNEASIKNIDSQNYVTEEIGLPTLQDIIDELKKPGLDPRGEVEAFSFADGINKIEDLEPGSTLPGIVTNITNFGAFVDVGVHCDGLVHISQLSNSFVKDPTDVISLHEKVQVKVVEVDIERKRISLSMKESS